MLRLTVTSETVAAATHRKGSGRGASVHRDPVCLQAAKQPGVLARAFKRPVELSAAAALTFSQLIATSRK